MPCPFCDWTERPEYIAESLHAVAIIDAYPLTRGHTLLMPWYPTMKTSAHPYFTVCPTETAPVTCLRSQQMVLLDVPYDHALEKAASDTAEQTLESRV